MRVLTLSMISLIFVAPACSREPASPVAVGVEKAGRVTVLVANTSLTEANAAKSAARRSPVESAAAIDQGAEVKTAQTADEHSSKTIDTNVVASLKRELVGVGRLDGQPITDVQLRSKCQTVFATGRATTIIDWTMVGNFAAREQGGIVTIPIDDKQGRHSFTMPDGVASRRVDGSLGLLADECEHGR